MRAVVVEAAVVLRLADLVAPAVAEASAVRAEQEGLAMQNRSIQRKWKR